MKRISTDDRKQQAHKIHNNKYDYSLWPDNVSLSTVVVNACTSHGKFKHTLKQHIVLKSGCPKCAGKGVSTDDRKQQAHKIHNNKYDYSLWPDDIIDVKHTKVQTKCPIHGIFEHTLNTHIHCKCGCPKCTHEKQQEFYKNKYGVNHHKQQHYSGDTMIKLQDKSWLYDQHITLGKTQLQIAYDLDINVTTVGRYLVKHNIAKQYGQGSQPQQELAAWIKSLGIAFKYNTRCVIPPLELDIYIPTHRVAIEYCGLFWHSEQAGKDKWYHHNKYNQCKDNNIQLITIFEDEWITYNDAVKSKLKSLLMLDDRERIMARRCSAIPIDRNTKKQFLEKYHIQGNGPSSLHCGLKYEGEIVAVLCLIKLQGGNYIINRYATAKHVVGGFGKLLEHVKKTTNWKSIITFADLRWSDGNLYEQTGWKYIETIPPDYYYSPNGIDRFHKFNYRRKMLPNKLNYFDPTKSEKVNCDQNNILRIWDCGKLKFGITCNP